MTDRVASGIKGFDELIEGGFPKGSFVLVDGEPGTGKTIFVTQFVVNQAVNNNRKVFFVSAEQTKEEIFSQAEQFGWDLQSLEKSEKVKFMALDTSSVFYPTTMEMLEKLFRSHKFDIVVIDSLTSITDIIVSDINIYTSRG